MRRLAALFVLLLIPVSGLAQDEVEMKATHVRAVPVPRDRI